MGIISWIIFGVVAGAIAKFIMPGRMENGFVMTSLLGIVGACVGGFIGTSLGFGKVTGFNLPSFFIAVLGAMIVSRFQVQSATPSPWVLASSKKTS